MPRRRAVRRNPTIDVSVESLGALRESGISPAAALSTLSEREHVALDAALARGARGSLRAYYGPISRQIEFWLGVSSRDERDLQPIVDVAPSAARGTLWGPVEYFDDPGGGPTVFTIERHWLRSVRSSPRRNPTSGARVTVSPGALRTLQERGVAPSGVLRRDEQVALDAALEADGALWVYTASESGGTAEGGDDGDRLWVRVAVPTPDLAARARADRIVAALARAGDWDVDRGWYELPDGEPVAGVVASRQIVWSLVPRPNPAAHAGRVVVRRGARRALALLDVTPAQLLDATLGDEERVHLDRVLDAGGEFALDYREDPQRAGVAPTFVLFLDRSPGGMSYAEAQEYRLRLAEAARALIALPGWSGRVFRDASWWTVERVISRDAPPRANPAPRTGPGIEIDGRAAQVMQGRGLEVEDLLYAEEQVLLDKALERGGRLKIAWVQPDPGVALFEIEIDVRGPDRGPLVRALRALDSGWGVARRPLRISRYESPEPPELLPRGASLRVLRAPRANPSSPRGSSGDASPRFATIRRGYSEFDLDAALAARGQTLADLLSEDEKVAVDLALERGYEVTVYAWEAPTYARSAGRSYERAVQLEIRYLLPSHDPELLQLLRPTVRGLDQDRTVPWSINELRDWQYRRGYPTVLQRSWNLGPAVTRSGAPRRRRAPR